jgi:hypothetical protein
VVRAAVGAVADREATAADSSAGRDIDLLRTDKQLLRNALKAKGQGGRASSTATAITAITNPRLERFAISLAS